MPPSIPNLKRHEKKIGYRILDDSSPQFSRLKNAAASKMNKARLVLDYFMDRGAKMMRVREKQRTYIVFYSYTS